MSKAKKQTTSTEGYEAWVELIATYDSPDPDPDTNKPASTKGREEVQLDLFIDTP